MLRHAKYIIVSLLFLGCLVAYPANVQAACNVIERLPAGIELPGGASYPNISADGKYVLFGTYESLVPEDTNNLGDVYVYDRQNNTNDRVSVDSNEQQATAGESYDGSITPDGRYIVFTSNSNGLVSNDTNGQWDIFLRDRLLGTTERISIDSNENQISGSSYRPSISDDGKYIAFQASALELLPVNYRGSIETSIYVRNRELQTTEWINIDANGTPGPVSSSLSLSALNPYISPNGQYVAFESKQSLVPGTQAATTFYGYIKDRGTSSVELISKDTTGTAASGYNVSFSDDLRYVIFSSFNPLVTEDTNNFSDVYVLDHQTNTLKLISKGIDGTDSLGHSGNGNKRSSISSNGRYAVFVSRSQNLVPNDTALCFSSPVQAISLPPFQDVFLYNLQTGVTLRLSKSQSGQGGNANSNYPSMSRDGKHVIFESDASNLVVNDNNGKIDVFHSFDPTTLLPPLPL